MQRYGNLSGNSGVVSFEIAPQGIDVEFRDRAAYRYTYQSAGSGNIEQMKTLAVAGRGLSAFINQHVRKLYAQKLR